MSYRYAFEYSVLLTILSNARVLSGVPITDIPSLTKAIATLHREYNIPHIIVTSVRFPSASARLTVIGSTAYPNHTPRMFHVDVPNIAAFFSGTGDMFAALAVARFREEAAKANLLGTKSWVSPADVGALQLPLARAVEKVCASMHVVLEKTKLDMDREVEGFGCAAKEGGSEVDETEMHLRKTKAAEVRVVRNQGELREPGVRFEAEAIHVDAGT